MISLINTVIKFAKIVYGKDGNLLWIFLCEEMMLQPTEKYWC